VRFRKN